MEIEIIIKGVVSIALVGVAFRFGESCAKRDHLIALIISTAIAIGMVWGNSIIEINGS